MAIKTFTTGEVLTASDTNTYLANSGLVYVTSQTFTGSSSPTVISFNNCFTSSFTNYRIVLNLNGGTAGAYASFRLRSGGSDRSTNDYFMAGYYSTWSGGLTSYNAGSLSSMAAVGSWSSSIASACTIDIFSPAVSGDRTNWSSRLVDAGAGSVYSRDTVYAVTEAQDGFTVFSSSGTMSGTITVYGYRKA